MKMVLRASALMLLTVALCMELGAALRCYTCPQETDLFQCTQVISCSPTDTICKTTTYSVDSGYPFFGNITVTKGCANKCVASDVDGIGITRPVSCCNTDLCNTDGAAGLTAGTLTLGAAAALAHLLLRLWP
ncbi:ly6/PLAUR domain-containing protein 2-like [Ornithorhynchus anatinus]|uniref:UPAR/Ly6 domain-containing protein n=1 Tax=Ornithorhynchus anatinus TaxID=9258 RepID=F6XD70_ORNAN|nr:ly6/PLAUR domain-containing protein 2-like [Ornithorhynchus anatinus]